MVISEQEFLAAFKPQKPWICSVVDFLISEPRGTAAIEKIAMAIDHDHLGVQAVKESIYSAIRPRCPELRGFNKKLPPIFENNNGILRLLSFPEKPQTGSEHKLFFSVPHIQQALESTESIILQKMGRDSVMWTERSRDDKWHIIARNEKLRNYFADIAESNRRLFNL
jgi:hypothetical protein